MYTKVFYANIYHKFREKIGFKDEIKAEDIRVTTIPLKKKIVDLMSEEELVAKADEIFKEQVKSHDRNLKIILGKIHEIKTENNDCCTACRLFLYERLRNKFRQFRKIH